MGVAILTISSWFSEVYESDFTPVTLAITITTQPVALTEAVVGSISGSLSVVTTDVATVTLAEV